MTSPENASSQEALWPSPEPYDPHKAARAEIAGAIDVDGRPTGGYWQILGMHAARQTKAMESMQKMMVFFTVVVTIGLIVGVIVGIIGAVELSHAVSTPTTTTDPFGLSNP